MCTAFNNGAFVRGCTYSNLCNAGAAGITGTACIPYDPPAPIAPPQNLPEGPPAENLPELPPSGGTKPGRCPTPALGTVCSKFSLPFLSIL